MTGPRRWFRPVWLGGALVVAAVVGNASQRTPCGPAAGTLAVATSSVAIANTKPQRLRIGTYNIHGGKGIDGVRDLGRIAETVRGCDFVGLNELHGPALWETDDQAIALGRLLQLTPLFAPAEQRWHHLQFGNGFVTRVGVDHWQTVPLPRRWGKSYRNFVHVQLRPQGGRPIQVVVAHIDRSEIRERHEQLRTVGAFFLSLAEPAILLGDLNSDGSELQLREVLKAPRVVDALRAKLGDTTPRHIDWIITRGVEVVDAGLTEPGPSDHPHVWADVIVPTPDGG
jgi:endonuclease/exonuclease/phosphatase family metal-dependent hydrolase